MAITFSTEVAWASPAHEQALQAGLLPAWLPSPPSTSSARSSPGSTKRTPQQDFFFSTAGMSPSSSPPAASLLFSGFSKKAPPPPLDLSHPLHAASRRCSAVSATGSEAQHGVCFCGTPIPPRRGSSVSTVSHAYSMAGASSSMTRNGSVDSTATTDSIFSHAPSSASTAASSAPSTPGDAFHTVALPPRKLSLSTQHMQVLREDQEEFHCKLQRLSFGGTDVAEHQAAELEEDDDEPAIYCSSLCARKDALSALVSQDEPEPAPIAFKAPTNAAFPPVTPTSPPIDLPALEGCEQYKQQQTLQCPGAPARKRSIGHDRRRRASVLDAEHKHAPSSHMLSTLAHSPTAAHAQLPDTPTIQERYPLLVKCLQRRSPASPPLAQAPISAVADHSHGSSARSSPTSPAYSPSARRPSVGGLGGSHYRRMEALNSSNSQLHDILSAVYGPESPIAEPELEQQQHKQHAPRQRDGTAAALQRFSFGGHAHSSLGAADDGAFADFDGSPAAAAPCGPTSRRGSHCPMESTSSQGSATTQASDATGRSAQSGITADTSVGSASQPHSQQASPLDTACHSFVEGRRGIDTAATADDDDDVDDYRPSRRSLEEAQLELEREARLRRELHTLDRGLQRTFDAFEFDEHERPSRGARRSGDDGEVDDDDGGDSDSSDDDLPSHGPYSSPLGWGASDALLSHGSGRSGDWKHASVLPAALLFHAHGEHGCKSSARDSWRPPSVYGRGAARLSRSLTSVVTASASASASAIDNFLGLQLGSPADDMRLSIAAFPQPPPAQRASRTVTSKHHARRASLAAQVDPPAPVPESEKEEPAAEQPQPQLQPALQQALLDPFAERDASVPAYPTARKERRARGLRHSRSLSHLHMQGISLSGAAVARAQQPHQPRAHEQHAHEQHGHEQHRRPAYYYLPAASPTAAAAGAPAAKTAAAAAAATLARGPARRAPVPAHAPRSRLLKSLRGALGIGIGAGAV